MIYAEVKYDGTLNQVWSWIDDPEFSPPLLTGSTLISFPDGTDVRPGMIWDGSQLLPPPPPPLADVKARAKQEVISFADEIASRPDVAGVYPQAEKEGWPTKLIDARAYKAGVADANQIAALQVEAAIRGKTIDALIDSILTNGAWFSKLTNTIAGMRAKAFDAIDAAADQAAVEAVLAQMKVDAEKALSDLLAVKP